MLWGKNSSYSWPPRQKIKECATPVENHTQLREMLYNNTIQWLWVARKREARLLLVDLFLMYFAEKWLLPPSLSVCACIHACVCIYADVFLHTWRNQGNNVQCHLLLLSIFLLKQCLSKNLKFINKGRVAGQQASWIVLSLPPHHWGNRHTH